MISYCPNADRHYGDLTFKELADCRDQLVIPEGKKQLHIIPAMGGIYVLPLSEEENSSLISLIAGNRRT